MKKNLYILFTALILTGCVLNLVTGRKQLSLVNESELQLMAANQYNLFLNDHKVLSKRSSKEAAMVDRVGTRIAEALKYYSPSD